MDTENAIEVLTEPMEGAIFLLLCETCDGDGYQAGAHSEELNPCPSCNAKRPSEYGKVLRVEGDVVTATPIYHPQHQVYTFRTTVEAVVRGVLLDDQLCRERELEQAAEIAAEHAIPQHLVW